MKYSLLAASVLVFGMSAFAADATSSATTTSAAAPSASASTSGADTQKAEVAAPGKKVAWKQAKEECLKETPSLKGKALRTCVKSKQGK